jgi:hypothetical protein
VANPPSRRNTFGRFLNAHLRTVSICDLFRFKEIQRNHNLQILLDAPGFGRRHFSMAPSRVCPFRICIGALETCNAAMGIGLAAHHECGAELDYFFLGGASHSVCVRIRRSVRLPSFLTVTAPVSDWTLSPGKSVLQSCVD